MAARFWVGGAGTWDALSTANWSATSGGAAGATAPTILDTATFDGNSGSGVVSVASTAVSLSTTVNNANINLSLTGSPMLCTAAGTLTLTTGTITLNTFTLTCGIFSSTSSSTRSIAFGTGKFNITGNNATVWTTATVTGFSYTGTPTVEFTYAGATGTRSIRHASSGGGTAANSPDFYFKSGTDTINFLNFCKVLDFTGFSGTLLNQVRTYFGNVVYSSGMTLTAGTSATTFGSTSGTQQITTAGKTLDFPLTFNGVGGTFAFQDALTQGSTRAFTITNGTVQLKAGVTSTAGSFATSGTNQKFLQSTLAGSRATLSQASGTVSVSRLTIKDINATGGATWQAFTTNNNIDAGNNLGWDFSSQIGRYIYTRRKNKRILP
jgi:hypothetical protein